MLVLEVAVFIAGALIVLATLWSAMLTVVIPRAQNSMLSRAHFLAIRMIFRTLASSRFLHVPRETLMARYAPVALILLPVMWGVHVMAGFAAMYWALGTRGPSTALALSGSSLTTLGFRSADDLPSLLLAIGEAGIGLGLVALLISYLPTMYGQFASREATVTHLEIRAGRPPNPAVMIPRMNTIGLLGDNEMWVHWEQWFIEIEESHTSHPALVFFRSAHPERSWVTSAGAALDTAAIILAAVAVPFRSSAALMLRAGFLSLRTIATYFDIAVDNDPQPNDAISVHRHEFDAVIDQLEASGVPIKPDRDQAWRDFVGWRVNYDGALLGLCRLVEAPPSPWSSDRAGSFQRPPVLSRSRRS